MIDPVVVFAGELGSSIALKATDPRNFPQFVGDWLTQQGASNLHAASGLAEPAKTELSGTPEGLADSLIRAAGRCGMTVAPCELDDTVASTGVVYCRRPNANP